MYTTEVKVGDIHYRCMPVTTFNFEPYGPPVDFQPYKVIKLTPCGYKVKSQWWDEPEKLILYASKKKWAYPTKEEALESFIRRKTKHLAILRAQVETIDRELTEAIKFQNLLKEGKVTL